jgi:hypothetical protein
MPNFYFRTKAVRSEASPHLLVGIRFCRIEPVAALSCLVKVAWTLNIAFQIMSPTEIQHIEPQITAVRAAIVTDARTKK